MVESHRIYFGSLRGDARIEVCRELAEGYTAANAAWIRRSLWAPRLDDLRPTYIAPPAAGGDESCQGILLAPALIQLRRGSCIDLACYHAGWLRARRSLPAVVEITRPAEGEPLHAVVRTEGDLFDPTAWILEIHQQRRNPVSRETQGAR